MAFLLTEIINFEVLLIGHNMANMLTEIINFEVCLLIQIANFEINEMNITCQL